MLINWFHRLYYAQLEWRDRGYVLRKIDPLTAMRLPDLGLPKMSRAARKALQDVIRYEEITVDNSLTDLLRLTEARGLTVHPCDWVPQPDRHPGYPDLYRPWAEWLAAKGYTPFSAGVRLTQQNNRRFGRDARQAAFRKLYQEDRKAAYDLLFKLSETQPARVRLDLLREIGGGASFFGNYPSDVPILKHFLNDPAEDIRRFARERLQMMAGLETAEANADHIAWHLEVKDDRIRLARPEYADVNLYVPFACTTLDALAAALGLSAVDLVKRWERDLFSDRFWPLAVQTESVEVRSVLAKQRLDNGEEVTSHLLRGVARPLWERGLRAAYKSAWTFNSNGFLEEKVGAIDPEMMPELGVYQRLEQTVLRELETGNLPVNPRHDELRVLGLALDKEAAEQVLREAIALGMSEDNPRLTMLKFNLQL